MFSRDGIPIKHVSKNWTKEFSMSLLGRGWLSSSQMFADNWGHYQVIRKCPSSQILFNSSPTFQILSWKLKAWVESVKTFAQLHSRDCQSYIQLRRWVGSASQKKMQRVRIFSLWSFQNAPREVLMKSWKFNLYLTSGSVVFSLSRPLSGCWYFSSFIVFKIEQFLECWVHIEDKASFTAFRKEMKSLQPSNIKSCSLQ